MLDNVKSHGKKAFLPLKMNQLCNTGSAIVEMSFRNSFIFEMFKHQIWFFIIYSFILYLHNLSTEMIGELLFHLSIIGIIAFIAFFGERLLKSQKASDSSTYLCPLVIIYL